MSLKPIVIKEDDTYLRVIKAPVVMAHIYDTYLCVVKAHVIKKDNTHFSYHNFKCFKKNYRFTNFQIK